MDFDEGRKLEYRKTEYLLRVAEKYHIPEDEIELTKKQLVSYTKEKEMLKERGEWDE